jgi:uncharacterized membrane protein
MPNFTFTGATRTITATEYSLAKDANYSSASPMTTQGYMNFVIDRSALVTGDSYTLTIYEKAGAANTQRQLLDPMTIVPGASLYTLLAPVLVGDGWDVTLKLATGSARSIPFSVRIDTNDVNAATVSAGVVTAVQAGIATAAAVSALPAAILATVIETGSDIVGGTLSLAGAIRVIVAQAAGRSSGYLTGAIRFRSMNNDRDRIAGTATPGGDGRSATAVDPT